MAEKKEISDVYPSIDESVVQASSAYATYLDVDPKNESQLLAEEIEEMLTKLEEFCAVVDMVRTDTKLALNRSLPEIYEKAKRMEETYRRIDQLEEFVGIVRNNVHAYEELVSTAEKDLGTLHSIKSLFNSFPLFASKKGGSSSRQKKFVAPPVFSTSDYISASPPVQPQGQGDPGPQI